MHMFINSPDTKRQYPKRLKLFFDFITLQGKDIEEQGLAFLDQAKREGSSWVAQNVMEYLNHHKERVLRNEIAPGTLKNMYRPIKTFCDTYPEVSDSIPWKRILKAMPKVKLYSNDRAPTIEEIRKLVEFPDRRIKPIVYVMCSSGIRVGAWDYLKWRHVTPQYNQKTGELIAAKLLVYAGTGDEYQTFITPEAYHALKEWMDFRASYGEQITGDSWLMRNIWKTVGVKRSNNKLHNPDSNKDSRKRKNSCTGDNENFGYRCDGDAANPEKLPSEAIKHILLRALYVQGIRNDLKDGENRHDFKGAHGMRKFYKTRAEQVMLRTNVEYLIGHSLGVSSSYYKPSEFELLTDYLKAVPSLTINDNNVQSLKEEQEKLEQKYKEKDMELKQLKTYVESYETTLDKRIDVLAQDIKERDLWIERLRNSVEGSRKNESYIRDLLKEVEALRDTLLKQQQQQTG
jgi:integrase